MSRKYRPSNGTEGMWFTEKYCMNCINCDPDPDGEKQCEILMRSLCYSVNEPEYPIEWTYDKDDNPVCTSWVKWDWGNDGDPDDPDNPKYPGPPSNDPNQLLMPFDIWDLLGVTDDIVVTKTVIIEREILKNYENNPATNPVQ